MLHTLLQALHFVTCLALIGIVLLQADKGEGLTGAFGSGGGAALFGKRGATGFFAKATTIAAVTFMLTSFLLGWQGVGTRPTGSVGVPDISNAPQ